MCVQFFVIVLLVFIAEVAGAIVILVFRPVVSCRCSCSGPSGPEARL